MLDWWDVDLERSTAEQPVFIRAGGERQGQPVRVEEIEAEWGSRLRADMGIRHVAAERLGPQVCSDIAAPLPHDLEEGGAPSASWPHPTGHPAVCLEGYVRIV